MGIESTETRQVGRLQVVGDSQMATVKVPGLLVGTVVMLCDNDLADKVLVQAQPNAFQRAMAWAKEHQDATEPWQMKDGAR